VELADDGAQVRTANRFAPLSEIQPAGLHGFVILSLKYVPDWDTRPARVKSGLPG
jgi:hypothetical protein